MEILKNWGGLSWDEEEEEAEAEERVVGGFGEGLDLTRTELFDPIHHFFGSLLLLFFFFLSFLVSMGVSFCRGRLWNWKEKEGGIRYGRDYDG